MLCKKSYWIWYPGDFELYHAMKQNFSRVERGCEWPAFWKSSGFRNRLAFRREYTISKATDFRVLASADSVGYVQVNEDKFPMRTKIHCQPGKYRISVHIACLSCVPSIYVEGEEICSDPGWMVEDYDLDPVGAAYNRYFTDPDRDPAEWEFSERMYEPVCVEEVNGGTLYTFETELTAALLVEPDDNREESDYSADGSQKADGRREEAAFSGDGFGKAQADGPLVYLGESRAEALDTQNCYYSCYPDPATHRCPRQALRFAFLPGCKTGDYRVSAIHQYVDIPVRASFSCGDELLNRIFAIAAHTHMLCSGVFFTDGIKRDKWIWGGDAYQSMLINHYLTGDREIEKRTLIALRGNDPVTTHVNTIVDYSLFWILSVAEYDRAYRDEEFLTWIYPKMVSLMELCLSQREEHGFLIGRSRDWIYIDWADFDRSGPLCAEQMLLVRALQVMAETEAAVMAAGGSKEATGRDYRKLAGELMEKVNEFYWDPQQEAYVDSFVSEKKAVTRHANIFAVLFDLVSADRQQQIKESVLQNDRIPAITTPYFRFYELEALCKLGCYELVLSEIKAYWGGMLAQGAVTFWEEFDPQKTVDEQYSMYGDPFGKSLCHAWAASPIYLLSRYFVGLRQTVPGGSEYEVNPRTDLLSDLDCTFPMGDQQVRIVVKNGRIVTGEPEMQE